jgi:hypothetical protein
MNPCTPASTRTGIYNAVDETPAPQEALGVIELAPEQIESDDLSQAVLAWFGQLDAVPLAPLAPSRGDLSVKQAPDAPVFLSAPLAKVVRPTVQQVPEAPVFPTTPRARVARPTSLPALGAPAYSNAALGGATDSVTGDYTSPAITGTQPQPDQSNTPPMLAGRHPGMRPQPVASNTAAQLAAAGAPRRGVATDNGPTMTTVAPRVDTNMSTGPAPAPANADVHVSADEPVPQRPADGTSTPLASRRPDPAGARQVPGHATRQSDQLDSHVRSFDPQQGSALGTAGGGIAHAVQAMPYVAPLAEPSSTRLSTTLPPPAPARPSSAGVPYLQVPFSNAVFTGTITVSKPAAPTPGARSQVLQLHTPSAELGGHLREQLLLADKPWRLLDGSGLHGAAGRGDAWLQEREDAPPRQRQPAYDPDDELEP